MKESSYICLGFRLKHLIRKLGLKKCVEPNFSTNGVPPLHEFFRISPIKADALTLDDLPHLKMRPPYWKMTPPLFQFKNEASFQQTIPKKNPNIENCY